MSTPHQQGSLDIEVPTLVHPTTTVQKVMGKAEIAKIKASIGPFDKGGVDIDPAMLAGVDVYHHNSRPKSQESAQSTPHKGIKCGACKGYHPSVKEVKACFKPAATPLGEVTNKQLEEAAAPTHPEVEIPKAIQAKVDDLRTRGLNRAADKLVIGWGRNTTKVF